MKSSRLRFVVIAGLITLWSCGQKHDHHDHASEPLDEESGNAALERQVDKIHNEAMGKMEDIYKLKEGLKKKMEEVPALAEEKKKEIESAIAKLDSADNMMMDWMHNFKPFPDSLYGAEKAREYLEVEMEKVKKLKSEMEEAIEKARSEQ